MASWIELIREDGTSQFFNRDLIYSLFPYETKKGTVEVQIIVPGEGIIPHFILETDDIKKANKFIKDFLELDVLQIKNYM